MTHVWYAIGHFTQWSLKTFLVPLGWAPVVVISVVMTIGTIYWLNLQAKYTRRAKEKGETI